MKKVKNTIVAVIAMIAFGTPAFAQDNVEANASLDVVSRYIWRGQALSDAAVQPTAGISYKGVSLSAWGSYDFLNTNSAKEFDLTLAYSIGGFNVGITDYWFSNTGVDNKYFRYKAHETAHVFEANVGYDFGPVAVQWFTNFAGDDGSNEKGKRAYSSYFEVSAPFSLASCDWTAKVGGVPYTTSFYSYSHGFNITNISLRVTKDIKLCKKFSLPVFAEGICNPSTEKGYFVVGFTVAP